MPVQLHFRESGSGPAMIILHGLFGSSDNWLTISRRLDSEFKIFLPDLRNHGQSPHVESHTYEDMAEDLELFFKNNNINRATILGHSMGGKLAMMFSAMHPEKTERLIVADIAPKLYVREGSGEEDQEMLLTLMEQIDLSSFSSRKEIDEVLAEKIKSLSLRQFLVKNIYRNKGGKFSWKINIQALKENLGHIIHDVDKDFFNKYKPIATYPVTFIRGLKSDYIRDEDIPLIHSIYPQAQITNIADAGHWLHAEQPDEFIEAILSPA